MTGLPVARAPVAGRPAVLRLAVGIVALEFAAAVASFVASTLLPLAGRVVRTLGPRRTLGVGVVMHAGGLVLAATAGAAWEFALGQFTGGLAGGLLAVFGVSSAIRHLDEAMRVRVVAASSAMWVLPALVGPAATLGLQHLVGWRWTVLAPVPVVLAGRLLLVRATSGDPPASGPARPLGRTLLVPAGVAGIALGAGWWPVALAGAAVAFAGVGGIMPAGTGRLTRGTPAALAAMTLFAVGYFGADSLITVLLTDAYRASLGRAAVVLSAAPLAWALTSLAVQGYVRGTATVRFPVAGLAVSSLGVLAVAVGTVTAPDFATALIGWTAAGVGVGVAYPALYLLATTTATGADAAGLATAVITAEAFGGLLGRALGGAISSGDGPRGLGAAYLVFAAALATAGYAATRTSAGGHVRTGGGARSTTGSGREHVTRTGDRAD